MTIEIRPITPETFVEFMLAEGAAFGARPSETEIEQRRAAFEMEQGLAAFDDGCIVGTAGAYSLVLTLPGGVLQPARGVSWVSVLPTHRRRGILTALMRRQLDDIAARGEALAMLTASESGIYGRFGYGVATSAFRLEIERAFAALTPRADAPGRMRLVEQDRAVELFAPLYERLRRARPGMVNRPPAFWRWIHNSQYTAADGTPFFAVYETPDGVTAGAVQYQVKQEWVNGLANSVLTVRELFGETPDACAAVWQYVLGVDLIRTIRTSNRPVDDPIRWMLADPRRLRINALVDDLYVRILDVPAALGARRYSAAGSLVLDVDDPFRPQASGRYRLDGGPDGAACVRSDAPADLALSVTDLGAAYLGGVSLTTLAEAGRVIERTPGALSRADALFATRQAPFCGTPF